MKSQKHSIFTVYKTFPQLLLLVLVFYMAMGVSKYAQVLFFQNHHSLINYSLSYSAMAVAGSFSFLISNQLRGWSLRRISATFMPVYALGMFLRVFPDSKIIAVLSGIIGGVGASVTLLVIRKWIFVVSDSHPDAKQTLVSARYTLMQVGTLTATILAGGVLSLYAGDIAYIGLMVISSLFMLSLSFVKSVPDVVEDYQQDKKLFSALPSNKMHGVLFFATVFFLGLTSALVEPIIPAVLRVNGFSVIRTSFWVTALGILTVIGTFIFQHKVFGANSQRSFLFNQLISGGLMILGVSFINRNSIILLLILSVSALSIAGFFIFKEMMEYDMFPKDEALIFLGLGQSGFLVGDAVGSPVGTLVFDHFHTQPLILLYGICYVACGLLYSVISRTLKHQN